MDLTGRMILIEEVYSNNLVIPVRDYSSGLYVLSIESEGIITTRRFEVQQ